MKNDSGQATIMIIDDEPENLNVLGELLRQNGWSVRAFPHGGIALASARHEAPDLILLDIRMPDMDGYEVCRLFKAEKALKAVPIIFLSAFSESSDKVRAFEAGGVDYITKPFAMTEVLARVRTHLRMHNYQNHLEELVRQRVGELAEAHRRLRIWDGAKSDWLNVLAHEMRTPLIGLFGVTEILLLNLPAGSDFHDLREDYESSRLRIEKLVSDALTLSQIDVASEDFASDFQCLKRVLQSAHSAIAKQVPSSEVRASLDALETVDVIGDRKLLERAFTDLLLAATHCVRAGEPIMLDARVSNGRAEVEISTGGPFLSPEALETFFDVGGQRMLLKGGGDFGLGPALAKRIIRLFNGNISARNGTDHGIILEISLPVMQTLSACEPVLTEACP